MQPTLPSPEELRKEWVERLERNEDVQGRQLLRYKNTIDGVIKMCCLGVACDILVQHGFGSWKIAREGSHIQAYTAPDGNGSSETSMVRFAQYAFGVQGTDVSVHVPEIEESIMTLTRLNDHKDYTFPMIAKAIRENYPIK